MNQGSYDDILNLPHHVSPTRPRMSMPNRAAQFAPFAALTGYDSTIAETARLTDRYADLGEDHKALLNAQFRLLLEKADTQPEITVFYFVPDEWKAGGAYVRAKGRVKKVDPHQQAIFLTDGTEIPFSRIAQLDGSVFRPLDSGGQER